MNILLKCKHGLFTFDQNSSQISTHLTKYGEWNELNFAILSQFIEKNDILVEIGSNFGYFSVISSRFLQNTGSILTFDCQKSNFLLTCANVSLNSLKNVFPSKSFIGEKQENCMYLGQNVQKTSLDSLKFPKIKLICINSSKNHKKVIEGAEKTIQKYKPIIITEGKKTNLLEKFGYQHIKLENLAFNQKNYFGNQENIEENIKITQNLYIFRENIKNFPIFSQALSF